MVINGFRYILHAGLITFLSIWGVYIISDLTNPSHFWFEHG